MGVRGGIRSGRKGRRMKEREKGRKGDEGAAERGVRGDETDRFTTSGKLEPSASTQHLLGETEHHWNCPGCLDVEP